jgi:hypothetical protein
MSASVNSTSTVQPSTDAAMTGQTRTPFRPLGAIEIW